MVRLFNILACGSSQQRCPPAVCALWGAIRADRAFFVFGRFIAKARRKRQTAYGLTDHRALVAVGTGSLSDSPVQYQPVNLQRSRDGSHVSVTFGRSANGWRGGASYANTGMELFAGGNHPVAFYDVGDVASLERALQQARG